MIPKKKIEFTEIPADALQYIDDNDIFVVNGTAYATIPSQYTRGKIANPKTGKDSNTPYVYIRKDGDGKWFQTRMDQDAENIKWYLNQQDIINRSNQIIENQAKQSKAYRQMLGAQTDDYVNKRTYKFGDLTKSIIDPMIYSYNYFFPRNDDNNTDIIDLSKENVIQVTEDTPERKIKGILTNDFVEKVPSQQTAQYIREHQNARFGKNNSIPYRDITTYYTIKDGKLVAGPLNIFDSNDVITPNRVSKNIGKIKKILYPELNDDLTEKTPLKVINTNNDTITNPNLNMGSKILFGDEAGNGIFMSYNYLSKEQQDRINKMLEETPRYPIMVDNGRYYNYFPTGGNIKQYKPPTDYGKKVFILGTEK